MRSAFLRDILNFLKQRFSNNPVNCFRKASFKKAVIQSIHQVALQIGERIRLKSDILFGREGFRKNHSKACGNIDRRQISVRF